MKRQLLELSVENFRSLRRMIVALGPLNVLIEPHGAGKNNLLEVFRFLADVINTDLQPAIDVRGGFRDVAFWGGAKALRSTQISLKATWTTYSSVGAPDEYSLRIGHSPRDLACRESFQFKRTQGSGRRITIHGQKVSDGSSVIPAVPNRQVEEIVEKFSGTNRRYPESDASDVLAHAIALGCIERPDGTNRSWQQFRTDAVDCCRTHIGSRGKAR